MREAVGGTLLMYLVITFLILYIIFMAFIMNYASAYRASNYVVTQIETCQGNLNTGACNSNPSGVVDVQNYIESKYGYKTGNNGMNICCRDNSKGSVYRVMLPIKFELPLVGAFSIFSVKSETKTIYNVSCSQSSFDIRCSD